MGRSIIFQLIFFQALIALTFVNSSYGQDKKIEYEALDVEGKARESLPPEEVIVETPETKSSDKVRKEQIEKTNRELEETLKRNTEEVVEIKEEPLPPEKIKVEEVEIAAPKSDPKPFYSFLFDDSKKSLFETEAKWRAVSIGLGFIQYFPGSFQTSADEKQENENISTALEVGIEFGEVKGWSFIPFLGLTLPEESEDGFFTQFRYSLGVEAAYKLRENLWGKLGTTTLFTTIKGNKSGRVDLGGGQGEFFVVSGARTSILNTLDLGLEYWIDKFAISWRTSITSAFDSEKRDFIHGLYVKYIFDFSKKSEVASEVIVD